MGKQKVNYEQPKVVPKVEESKQAQSARVVPESKQKQAGGITGWFASKFGDNKKVDKPIVSAREEQIVTVSDQPPDLLKRIEILEKDVSL